MNFPLPETLTIGTLIAEQAQRYGDKPFLIFPEKDQTVTYAQLDQMTAQTASLLARLGVSQGDKIAILLPNIPEFLYIYWGAMRLGAVAGPINTLLKGPEIQYIAEHCNATVFVTTPAFLKEITPILSQLPQVRHWILIQDTPEDANIPVNAPWLRFETELLQAQAALEALPTIAAQDDAMIIYTSGTTGKPKGVLLTHRNLLTDAHYIRTWFGLTENTRMMCILPLFHVNGEVVTMMTPLLMGGSVVLNRKFSASGFWQLIAQYQVHVFSTVPTILSILLAQAELHCPVPSLQFGICGAAPLPVEVHRQFEETFQAPIYEGYGLSETTCYSTFNPPDLARRKIGSIGMAVGNDVAIWDEAGQALGPGYPGEIVIRGDNVMRGYYQMPEATVKAFAGGWFHSGDWGQTDEDGFFYILDRVKDMIIRGGENIYPREIDEVLYTHPDIAAAATIGVVDPKYGEEVKSFVVVKPDHTLTEAEILAFCRARLADFKCPKSITFIDEIPKGPTGKLLRTVLRIQASQEMSEPT